MKPTYEELQHRIKTLEREVVALRRAEEALRKSEDEKTIVLDNASEIIAYHDMNHCLRWANKAYLKATGLSLAELKGRKCYEAWGLDKSCNNCPVTKAMQTGEPCEAELTPQNQEHWPSDQGSWLSRAAPVKDAAGTPVGAIEVAYEITERKRAWDRLKVFERAIEASSDAVGMSTAAGEHYYQNPAFDKLFGDIGSDPPSTLYVDEKVGRKVFETIKGGNSWEGEVQMWGADREIRTVLLRAYPIKDEAGRVTGLVGVHTDITERKRAEEALHLNESRVEALLILNQMSESPMREITDFALEETVKLTRSKIGYLAFVNEDETVLTMHSWSKEAMAQCRITDKPIVYPVETTGLWGEAVRQRKPVITNDYSASNIPKKGYPKGHVDVIRHMNVPVMDGERIVAVAGVGNKDKDYDESDVRQLTLLMEGMWRLIQRKRADEEKKKLEAQLRRAEKMEAIGTMAGGIAHDFNNILAAIIGYTELAREDVPENSNVHANLQEVYKGGVRAKQLVEQILTFSRQSEQEKKPLRIGPIIKEALKLLRASLPSTVDIRQNMQSKSDTILADPTQIHQVLMNLCTNAGHAMKDHGGVLEVSLDDVDLDAGAAARSLDLQAGPYVRLAVSDTGSGMDRAVMERIFDPFYTSKGPGEGTGMGLAVVHGIVKSHDGAVSVYSEPGKGTTFHAYFPRTEICKEPEAEAITSIPTGTERVLLVDDEKSLVDMGIQMLQRLGYEVTARTSSLEALEAFRAQPDKFDLVITDRTMPNMTGTELAAKLISIRSDIPIIMCTGFSTLNSKQQAPAPGVREIIAKPIVKHQLARTIRRVLDEEDERQTREAGRILVIDDDTQVRSMLRQLLERSGYTVMEAEDGRAGIRLFREEPFDLVITDLIMPDKEGIETIRDLRGESTDVKIMAISGGGRIPADYYLHLAKTLGVDHTFAKPFESKEMLQAVQQLINKEAE